MLKHVDFVASDVPGFTFPVYLAGAPRGALRRVRSDDGTAVNLTLLSYDGTCCVGVTIDTAAVPDPEVLVECLREGFEEVLVPRRRPRRRCRLPLADGMGSAARRSRTWSA